jgi:F-type H+-transporting ATPase subunit b
MQFDWTTFTLEIINFLVLVWILKRFFYRPVLDVLDARQQRIQAESAQAKQLQQEAESLKHQYEARLADWNKEREQVRQQLDQEIAQARAISMENLKKSLADEESKTRVRDAAVIASREAELVRQSASEAYSNAAMMLQRLASGELTASIVRMFQEDLAALPPAERVALQKAAHTLGADASVEIDAAHPLDDKALKELTQALSLAAEQPLKVVFKLAPELIAGLRVAVGECLMHANLAEELAFFRTQGVHLG